MSSTKITYPDKIDGISYYSSANANEVKDATNNNADILDTATTDIADIRRSTETATYTPYSALTNKRDHTIFVQTGAIGEDATVIIGDASQINDSVTVVVEGDYNANLIMTGLPAEQVFSKKSRYYIWDGFNWYIPMEGAKGDQGEQGIQGIQGEQGIQGLQGDQGIQGIQGVSVEWLGSFGSAPSSPTLNQAYYNTSTKKSYVWDGDSWEQMTQDGVDGEGVAGEVISLTPAEMNLPPDNALWATSRIYVSQTSNAAVDFGLTGETLGIVVCEFVTQYRANQTFYEKLGLRSYRRGANETTWTSWYEQWSAGNDGPDSGLDADTLDGEHASAFLKTTDTIDADTLDTLNSGNASGNIPISNGTINTNLNADTLDGLHGTSFIKSNAANTGQVRTSNDIISGEGSGGVALTINDGYGNANVTFNHDHGVPEQDGNAGRIEVNTDLTTGASMIFGVKSGVLDGVGVGTTDVLKIEETQASVLNNRILTIADEGTGNGLDADTLDGSHATDIFDDSGSYRQYRGKGGATTGYTQISASGLLPQVSGGSGSIGALSWPWNTIYGKAIYDDGNLVYSAANPPPASQGPFYKLTAVWTGVGPTGSFTPVDGRTYLVVIAYPSTPTATFTAIIHKSSLSSTSYGAVVGSGYLYNGYAYVTGSTWGSAYYTSTSAQTNRYVKAIYEIGR